MRATSVILLAGLGLAVSACGGASATNGLQAARGMGSIHQPVVSRQDFVFDVNAADGDISSSEQGRLQGWFDTLGLGYGDRVSVDMGEGYSPAAKETVADITARYGLLLDAAAPVTTGALAAGNVRVVVSRMSASVPGCPDWNPNMSDDFNNNNHANFGCSINGNLAAMIANPADLVTGQVGSGTTDARTSGKAINTYRSMKPTGEGGLKQESARSN